MILIVQSCQKLIPKIKQKDKIRFTDLRVIELSRVSWEVASHLHRNLKSAHKHPHLNINQILTNLCYYTKYWKQQLIDFMVSLHIKLLECQQEHSALGYQIMTHMV